MNGCVSNDSIAKLVRHRTANAGHFRQDSQFESGCCLHVGVAQLVERCVVAAEVEESYSFVHPM